MITGVEEVTVVVFTLKVAEFCPDGITTLLGFGVAALELLENVTVVPAVLLSVTVPETVPPPMTEAADSVTPLTDASFTAPFAVP
jgi:hypothetical protein